MTCAWDYGIAVKKLGEKRARLLSDHGKITSLKLKAVRFDDVEKASLACIALAKANPGWLFKPKKL